MKEYVGQQRQRFFILLGLIAITVGGVTIIVVNRLLLKPLSLIREGTEAIGKGEFRSQIPIKSKDEIGLLADNFNRMAQRVRKKDAGDQVSLFTSKKEQETFNSIMIRLPSLIANLILHERTGIP
jgi:HAMP domain-containing protein